MQPQDVFEVREIWARLCKLQARVWEAKTPNGHDAADCFCGESGFWPLKDARSYRNNLYAIEYIERAVDRALARDDVFYGEAAEPRVGLCRFTRSQW